MKTHAIGELHDITAHKDIKPVENRWAEVEVGSCMLATKGDTFRDVGRRGAAGEDPVLADVDVDAAEALLAAGSPSGRRGFTYLVTTGNRFTHSVNPSSSETLPDLVRWFVIMIPANCCMICCMNTYCVCHHG